MEHEESEKREEGEIHISVDPMSVDVPDDVIDCGDDGTFALQGKVCPAYCRCRRRGSVIKKDTKTRKDTYKSRRRRGFVTK